MLFSDAYVQLLSKGAFAGTIDPWSEAPHYFQQIHASMIGYLAGELQTPLMKMGYYVGREASLQIAENRELESEVTLDALHIYHQDNGLVTVVEIVSPGNKVNSEGIADYRQRRERLVIDKGVNVVEIDPTRSIKKLVAHPDAARYPYHVMIYLPDELPHLIEMNYGQPMKRIALPLRGEVIPVELQSAYDFAYRQVAAGAQMLNDDFYLEPHIPFSSLLTDLQIKDALAAVARWRESLDTAKPTT